MRTEMEKNREDVRRNGWESTGNEGIRICIELIGRELKRNCIPPHTETNLMKRKENPQ